MPGGVSRNDLRTLSGYRNRFNDARYMLRSYANRVDKVYVLRFNNSIIGACRSLRAVEYYQAVYGPNLSYSLIPMLYPEDDLEGEWEMERIGTRPT